MFGARRELLGEGAPHIVVAEAAFRLLQAVPQPGVCLLHPISDIGQPRATLAQVIQVQS
ncbi:hypothetical protein [Nocardia sienata]|uniref:hypothetical protein n=1 Tax=Nocardia sienata TaxID=248552 RepID=UPI001C3F6A7B|nr:hypothetical protein [Nocardia sienata]